MRNVRTSAYAAAVVCSLTLGNVRGQNAVDLHSWTPASYTAGSGNWVVSADGNSVQQTINGNPTFFCSDFTALGTQIEGRITVVTFSDDDFVGFALGLAPGDMTDPNAEFLLIDWKQGDQSAFGAFAPRGLAVSRVFGIPTTTNFWGHTVGATAGVEELQRGATLGNVGWIDYQLYSFTFEYTPTTLKVFVNGVQQIDLDLAALGIVPDPNGRLCFYNFSQGSVAYAGFGVELLVDHLAFAAGAEPDAVQREGQTWDPITVRLEDLNNNLVSTATDTVTVELAEGTGTLSGTLSKAAVGGLVTFDDLVYDTSESIRVNFSSPNLAGLSRTILVTPFAPDLRITSGDISFVPATPAAGQTTTILALVHNVGTDTCDARVSFYRGDPDFGGSWIGTTGLKTVGTGDTVPFDQAWTPQVDGLQSILAVVENLSFTDSTPADNRASTQVAVGAAAEELQVVAGERIAWPGAQTSVPITITNVGFGAATITGASFGPPLWLTLQTPDVVGKTLQPGESVLALVELSVPLGTPGGTLNGTPLVQTVPVDFDTASGTFSADLVVKLFDQAASTVTVRVLDDATNAPIANALVAAQELPGSFVTGSPSGEVPLQLPPGPNGLFAYRTGYIAKAGTFDIPEGPSTVEIRLESGQTLGVEQVVSQPLSTQEILDRGIDVSDSVNNAVYDFVVAMQIGEPLVLPNIELPKVEPTSGSITFSGVAHAPGGGGGSFGGYGGGGAIVVGRFDYNIYGRTETYIVIPGQVWVLKQFFEVQTFVYNNAQAANPEDVQLRNVQANLNLPPGIGLPDLNDLPQQLTQSLPDLNAQESATATWIIRGDAPGTYLLNGLVTADLYAFQNFQTALSALATSEPFDVTVPRIRCEFITPTSVSAGQSFTFGVLVTNESSAPAQLVRVILEEADLINCTLVGTESIQLPAVSFTRDANMDILSAIYTIGDLDPGISGLAQFELISAVSGIVERVEIQNGCGVAPSPGVEVTPQPPEIVDQPAPVTACEGAVATFQITADGLAPITYQWRKDGVPIGGATSSELNIQPVAPDDAGSYDVVVTNPGGETISDAAILTVQVPVSITDHPDDATVCVDDPVSFSVVATGDPAPTYQWYKDGAEIPGATASSYSIANASTTDAGQFSCTVTNPCGFLSSSAATLVVNVPPEITDDPDDRLVTEGESASFSVVATGDPAPTYQWRKDGADLPGETAATLTIATVTVDHAGSYDCVVTNDCGSVTSGAAVLTVNQLPVVTCTGPVILWSPAHDLVDVSSSFTIEDLDRDALTVTYAVYGDEPEVPETRDGTGKHAPDFKNELGGRGLLVRSERQGTGDGRFYILVMFVDDGRGGVVKHACAVAVCPHDQNNPASLDDVLSQASAAEAAVQSALDSGGSLPPAGLYTHGVSGELGPKQ